MKTLIYAVKDAAGKVRWVGQTNNLHTRAQSHWVKYGKRCSFMILQAACRTEGVLDLEREWIGRMLARGEPLDNYYVGKRGEWKRKHHICIREFCSNPAWKLGRNSYHRYCETCRDAAKAAKRKRRAA